jgi:hypothetical protein
MERAAEGINALFGKIAVACLVLTLGLVSTGYGDIILGDWESPDSNDGWVAYPGTEAGTILVPASTIGVTLGDGSLSITPDASNNYWYLRWEGSPIDLTDANLQFDLTMKASDWPDPCWTKVAGKVAINSNGLSGWKEWGVDVPDNNITVINRDTGVDANVDWKSSEGDVNKTYIVDVSNYNSMGATWFQINVSIQGGNGAGHFYFDNARVVAPSMVIKKCTVTAGKVQGQDAFDASGTLNSIPADLNDIDEIDVSIISVADDEVGYSESLNFDVVKNKYTYKIPSGQTEGITSLTIDFAKRTFAIKAKNIDLTGLTCPLMLEFVLGSSILSDVADEAIVNGPKKLIPIRLMKTYADTLRISKAKSKHSTKALSDSFSVSGEIAVEDITDPNANLAIQDVNVIWGAQTFTIPSGSFAAKTGRSYKCSKVPVDSNGLMTATIDLDKCAYTVSLTKANLDPALEFGLRFADFNEIAELP